MVLECTVTTETVKLRGLRSSLSDCHRLTVTYIRLSFGQRGPGRAVAQLPEFDLEADVYC